MELIFRVNTYNSNEELSDIDYSNTFKEFSMALENYNREVAENQDRMVELGIEFKDGIVGEVYPILNSKKIIDRF